MMPRTCSYALNDASKLFFSALEEASIAGALIPLSIVFFSARRMLAARR